MTRFNIKHLNYTFPLKGKVALASITNIRKVHQLKSKVIAVLVVTLFSLKSQAQCAMCRAVLESEEGQTTAEGVNDGIMYLMSIPYILVGGIGFLIYWKYFRKPKEAK